MLAITFSGDLFCPVVHCDHCHDPIERDTGMACWLVVEDPGGCGRYIARGGRVYHIHARCARPFARAEQVEAGTWIWTALPALLGATLSNMGAPEDMLALTPPADALAVLQETT